MCFCGLGREASLIFITILALSFFCFFKWKMFVALLVFVIVSVHAGDTNATSMFVANDTAHIRVVGRTVTNGTSLIFDWSSVFIEVMYRGV